MIHFNHHPTKGETEQDQGLGTFVHENALIAEGPYYRALVSEGIENNVREVLENAKVRAGPKQGIKIEIRFEIVDAEDSDA